LLEGRGSEGRNQRQESDAWGGSKRNLDLHAWAAKRVLLLGGETGDLGDRIQCDGRSHQEMSGSTSVGGRRNSQQELFKCDGRKLRCSNGIGCVNGRT